MPNRHEKRKPRLGKRIDNLIQTRTKTRSAQRHERNGEWEKALLDHAYLIRNVSNIRETMRSYRELDRLVREHPESLSTHRIDDQLPDAFVLFIGYGRSGHSLIGSLLDAHENIVISHEMNVLKQLERGCSYVEIAKAAKYNAHFFEYFGREYTGYDYVVPNQHQGHYGDLQILGDKKGNATTQLLRTNPELLDLLETTVPVPIFFVHVIRNPYDNIATRAARWKVGLEESSRRYFGNVETVSRLKKRIPERVFDVYLDDLMADPRSSLTTLLHALGVQSISDRYLSDCASILFDEPRRTRNKFDWSTDLRREVESQMRDVDFLHRFAQ